MSKNPEYEPYQPTELDENGRISVTDWERQRDANVQNQIRVRRSLTKQERTRLRQKYSSMKSRPEKRISTGAIMAGAWTVVACVALASMIDKESSDAPGKGLSPVERFETDYLSYDGCRLEDSAYDVTAANKGKASVTPPIPSYDASSGILTITPVGSDKILQLESFDQFDHTITPVHNSDEAILETYGCEVENY